MSREAQQGGWTWKHKNAKISKKCSQESTVGKVEKATEIEGDLAPSKSQWVQGVSIYDWSDYTSVDW